MFQIEVVEKVKTHFLFSNFFPLKIVPFMEKYGGAREATNDNMAHVCCILDK